MRISDWSSDVCSSDLLRVGGVAEAGETNEIAAELRGDVVVRHIRQLAQDQTQHHGKGRSLFQSAAAGMPKIGRASCRERVSVRVDLGGRRIIKENNITHTSNTANISTHKREHI